MSAATSVPHAAEPWPGAQACDSAMLEALLAQAPVGFAFVGQDLRLRRVSTSLAEMIGVKPGEQLGHLLAEVWPAAVASAAESAVQQVLAGGQPVAGSVTLADRDDLLAPGSVTAADLDGLRLAGGRGVADTIVPDGLLDGAEEARGGTRLALSWYPAHNPDGTLTGVTMIAVDVSGRQESAEQVRRTNERYRSLVQAGNQVVWVTGPTGQVTEDSPEWRWITGQSVQEYLADGWLAALHPDDVERTRRDWLECIRTGTVFDGSYRVRTKTGSYRHYDVRAVPIERDGEIVEWMGASTDVTSQREADEMRGRLTEQLSAAALRTSRLQQATSLLAKALSVRQVVAVITEVGQSAIGADRSAVAIVDKARPVLRIMSSDNGGQGHAELTGEIPLDVPSVLTATIALRRPLVLDSPESLRRQFEADGDVDLLLRHSDERAWIGLPLTTSGTPFGALQFSFRDPRQIPEEERVFLDALAGQCALALERATLYEREHTTAETLQRSLLPDNLPVVPGIALTALYRPVSIEVGGDWYDAFRLPDGKLAVAAGDVMGKGLTAAAGMGRVRNALRALALTDPRPAAVLAGLDRLFIATELDEQVTTVCYLVVDPATGEGVVGNAGHLPPLLLSPDAPPRLDQTEAGTPLGWASPRQQFPFSLPPGNTAVLYSDGLVENRKRGLDVGLDELVAVAAQAPPATVGNPDRLIKYLVDKMLAGYEQDDDVTVLVLQMPGRAPAGRGNGSKRARKRG
ncbi:MAG TPA: SpoIIE family protein phosphatase [Streptosporangiaceae bacterium]|nr:SpoIIE family protein phosphatase [Streptosporangiaceae bacterium]